MEETMADELKNKVIVDQQDASNEACSREGEGEGAVPVVVSPPPSPTQ
jgi:hypothetical protein